MKNYRVADRCCKNCKHLESFDGEYERYKYCNHPTLEAFDNTYVDMYRVCDLWEGEND